jgi:hypothetical protein
LTYRYQLDFTQKIVTKLSEIWVGGPGSEIWDQQKNILGPKSGGKKAPHPGSTTLFKVKVNGPKPEPRIRITDADLPPTQTHLGAGVAGVEEVNAVAVHDG